MMLGYAPQSSWIFSPTAPASIIGSRPPCTSVRADGWRPMFTGVCSKASSVARIRSCGSSNPAVIRVVTPADSATGTRRGESRCTCESTTAGVAISPWQGIGQVFGPIVRSMPSVMPGLPALPMPAMRPSLMPRSHFATPRSGSITITDPMTASSSDA